MSAFVIAEIDGPVEAVISGAMFPQGLVAPVAPLAVSVAAAFYEIGGQRGQYPGVGSVGVTDNATNFVYLDGSGSLVVATGGWPATTHLRLAQVFASSGVIVNTFDVRPFFTATNPKVADDTFVFGAGSLGLSVTPRFLAFGYNPQLAPSSPVTMLMARAGVLSRLSVKHNLTGSGGPVVYTLRLNGVDTALNLSLGAGVASGQNTSATVSVAAGDSIDFRATKTAALTQSPQDILATLEFNV